MSGRILAAKGFFGTLNPPDEEEPEPPVEWGTVSIEDQMGLYCGGDAELPEDVPADATVVVFVMHCVTDSADELEQRVESIATDFTGVVSIIARSTPLAGERCYCAVGVAEVLTTGPGKNINIEFSGALFTGAAAVQLAFLKGMPNPGNFEEWVRDSGCNRSNDGGPGVDLDSVTTDIVLAHAGAFSNVETTPSGWTSISTISGGAIAGNLRKRNIAGASSTACYVNGEIFTTMSAICIRTAPDA